MLTTGYRQLIFATDMNSWQQLLPAPTDLSLVLSDSPSQGDATLSRYRDYLGHEYPCVVIDCTNSIHVDAIAALAGTITAGGYLVLVGNHPTSAIWQRFKSAWSELQQIPQGQPPQASELPALPTPQQRTLLKDLNNTAAVHIVTAPRGRGKSHVLGAAIAELSEHQPDRRVVVTAPRKANARVLLNKAPKVQFVAWDKLLKEKKADALLVIDEAAGLPLWAIQQLCNDYTPWLMATTVEGYEGCGRGFAIHFSQWASEHLANVQQHALEQPIRWPINDPLERWLQQTLLLTKAPADASRNEGLLTTQARHLPEADLHQAFELLLEAHYQSSPNDLALLLDDSSQFITLLYQQQRVIGVCWHALEGPLQDDLCKPILQGKRRPPGNLLPQAIGYYLQQPWALKTRWCRITRIAVHPDFRRCHYASALIAEVKAWAKHNQCEALGTSFGYSPALAKFWQHNGFTAIRTSNKRDRVSARHQHIRACWLADTAPTNWHPLLDYAQAELQWINGNPGCSLSANPIIQQIKKAVANGYMPEAAAAFALSQG